MFPERRSGQLATVETDVVRGKDGRWRVNYWMITKLHGPGSAAAADSASAMSEGPPNVHKLPGKKKGQTAGSQREAAAEAAPDRTGQVAHLDAKWLLVPLGIVAARPPGPARPGNQRLAPQPQVSGRVGPTSLRPRPCTST